MLGEIRSWSPNNAHSVNEVNWILERPDSWEARLTGSWTPDAGVTIRSSDLPPRWDRALDRLGRDLGGRHFAGSIDRIEFEVGHYALRDDDECDYHWLSSSVTPYGDEPHGMGHSGSGVLADADEEAIVVSCADLVQDQIARAGIVWPRGRAGGFLGAVLVDGIATWSGIEGETSPIGALQD